MLQFFYENPAESIRVGFTPVRVTSDEEVKGVVALVTEKADEYNKKHGLSEKPVQYLSSAVRARSLLLPEIVRHIDRCFTKRGIKEAQRGVKKRTYQPRPALTKTPRDQVVKPIDLSGAEKNVEGEHAREEDAPGPQKFEEEDNEEEVGGVEECVPEEGEMKGVLEEKIFGGLLPKAVRKLKPTRKGFSER